MDSVGHSGSHAAHAMHSSVIIIAMVFASFDGFISCQCKATRGWSVKKWKKNTFLGWQMDEYQSGKQQATDGKLQVKMIPNEVGSGVWMRI
jgi:hypothetical protein